MDSGAVDALTDALFGEILTGCITDQAQSSHRTAKTAIIAEAPGNSSDADFYRPLKRACGPSLTAPHATTRPAMRFKPLPPRPGVRGPVDVFGRSHPSKATDVVTCKSCGRQVTAGTFAPHLEKCMGKGRASSRAAARRIQSQLGS